MATNTPETRADGADTSAPETSGAADAADAPKPPRSALQSYLAPVRADGPSGADIFAGKIRVTPDGLASVIDLVRVICFMDENGTFASDSKNSALRYWARLEKEHSELRTNCPEFTFPGKGQRATPVATRNVLVQIVMVLPGRRADAFRQHMADFIERYLDGDRSLADEIYARADARDANLDREPRIQSCESTKAAMKSLHDNKKDAKRSDYAAVNNLANELVTGYACTADYRKSQGLTKPSQLTRDTFTDKMNHLTSFFNIQQAENVKAGRDPVASAVQIRNSIAPGLRQMGYYDSIAGKREQAVVNENKRLMEQHREAQAKRIKSA